MPANPEHDSAPTISRRRILRVGATTAWAVPAITVIAAAPAMAVSGPAALTQTATKPYVNNAGALGGGSITVMNTGGTATAALKMVVTINTSATLSTYGNTASTTPAGWNTPTTAAVGLTGRTFTYTAAAQVPAGGVLVFAPTYTLGLSTNVAGTFTATASATGVTSNVLNATF